MMLIRTKIIIYCLFCFYFISCSDRQATETGDSSNSVSDADLFKVNQYVGAQKCAECHQDSHHKWLDSHHYHAMELPNEKTVRADFNNTTFENYGITTRFFRNDEKFLVETENQEGEMEIFEVAYTFGWEPLQQYLVKFPDGRMQVLPTCWDVEKKRWYHLYPDERIAPDDPLFWTRSMQNWDHMCADCHSTNLRKQFDSSSQTFSTVYSEINVACESCHGPGRKHVEIAESQKGWKGLAHFALADINSSNISQIESCAKCHARRGFIHPGHHAGKSFVDHFLPEVVQPWSPDMQVPTYHVDGQIDDEVYVYGSYIQSKMFHKGVKCTDCHDPHSVKLHSYENQLCTRCHVPNDKNPSGYDNPGHHFHPIDSTGAKCVECHMPHKTYMGIDQRRDHSIRIPRPDHSLKYGTPNACNQCHQDKDAKWAADAVLKFKGPARAKDNRHPSAFHSFRMGEPDAEKLLLKACRDLEAPAFTRAGAMLALREFISEISFSEARKNLDDNASVVRVAAVTKLENLPLAESFHDLTQMLKDPVRSVRTEAARVLARAPEALFSEDEKKLFEEVFLELKSRYESNLDRPESNLSLGILAENRNQAFEAERYYRQAIQREDTYVPARMNLATLLSRRGRNQEAEILLREAVKLQPTWGQVHYSLGLLLAEDRSRLSEAIRYLERASAYWKDNPRVFNNLAIAYWQSSRTEEAIRSFFQALSLAPESEEYIQNLIQLLSQSQQWRDALPHAKSIVLSHPRNPQLKEFLDYIESMLER